MEVLQYAFVVVEESKRMLSCHAKIVIASYVLDVMAESCHHERGAF